MVLAEDPFFTHYVDIDDSIILADFDNKEMAISELKINRYFAHFLNEEYITLANYRELTQGHTDVEFITDDYTIVKNDKHYVLTEAVRIKIPVGIYKTLKEFISVIKTQCMRVYSDYGLKLQEWSNARRLISEDPTVVSFKSQSEYYNFNLVTSQKEFYFGRREKASVIFEKLLDRVRASYNDRVLIVGPNMTTDNAISRIICSDRMADILYIKADSLISNYGEIISSLNYTGWQNPATSSLHLQTNLNSGILPFSIFDGKKEDTIVDPNYYRVLGPDSLKILFRISHFPLDYNAVYKIKLHFRDSVF